MQLNEGIQSSVEDGPVREPQVPLGARPEGGLAADFVMAIRFFSRLPTGRSKHEVPDLNRIAMALPLASVAIGILPALLLVGGTLMGLPAYFAAAMAVGAAVMAGGGMSEDALADSADGLFGGGTR